ncbi:DUF421 domain-containing protein [Prosthecobacter sp.]|uniref:DUF421 domain-containing protein n=1 Tax=Prosthecobacter sp. TaxID=1965333 RepID=UPI003783FE1E
MWPLFTDLFGLDRTAETLEFHQMIARAVVVFISGIVLVRIADKRSFAKKSAFDVLLILILGSIMGRSITGTERLFPTVGACFFLILLHRLMGSLACRWPRLETWVKGHTDVLAEDGRLHEQTLRRHHISGDDFAEQLRLKAMTSELPDIRLACLERSGEISFIKRRE